MTTESLTEDEFERKTKCDKDIDELMDLEDSLRNKIKTEEVQSGVISDVDLGNKIVEFEIYVPKRDEYKYASYRLNRGDKIKKLLESLGCGINDITSVINKEVLLYSSLNSTNWYIAYSRKDIKSYLNENDNYKLQVPPFNTSNPRITQKNILPQLYITILTMIPALVLSSFGLALLATFIIVGTYTFGHSLYLEQKFDISVSRLKDSKKVK